MNPSRDTQIERVDLKPDSQTGNGAGAWQGPVTPPADYTANWKNMNLLIQLRWIAVIGQVVTIAVVHEWLNLELPLLPMFLVLAGLIGLNLASIVWLRNDQITTQASLFIVLVFDVAALTAQLYLSGGATNPFIFLYLLQART